MAIKLSYAILVFAYNKAGIITARDFHEMISNPFAVPSNLGYQVSEFPIAVIFNLCLDPIST